MSGRGQTLIDIPVKGVRVARAMAFLRARGVRHGSLPYIRGKLPRLDIDGDCLVGERFKMDCLQFASHVSVAAGARLVAGDDVFLNRGLTMHAAESIELGDHLRVGDLTSIHDSDFHEVEPGRPVRVEPVRIGCNVWLGRCVVVLPGTTIGDHCVVAAGSVVRGSFPDGVLVAGAPGRVVRELAMQPGWVRS